jgi:hypothetical protein
MTKLNLTLLNDARATRRNLLASRHPANAGSTIRDAVELAADGLRQEADEQDRMEADYADHERELDDMAWQG